MEEESNISRIKTKTLVTPVDVPIKMKKSSSDKNPKQSTNTSDEELGDKAKTKLSKEIGMMSRRSRKVRTKRKEPGMSMYGMMKEPSKRGLRQSRKSLKQKKQQSKVNEAVIRTYYCRAKNRLQKGRAQSNSRNQEGIVCPEEISNQVDVPEEYDTEMIKVKPVVKPEVSVFNGLLPMNNENNGNLFINGVPFWCLKDEKPPVINCIGSTTLKDLVDKKFTLLKELPEPKDLDPFHEMTTMTNRDEEYFNKTNRVVTNTIRSIVGANDFKKTSEVRPSKILSICQDVLGIQVPVKMYVYNRRSRFEPMKIVSFTPGALATRKKGILTNFLF